MPIKVRWWQKLVTKPKPMPSRQIQNWRNLSPDEPPLPFFAAAITTVAHKVAQTPIKFSELDSNTSEIAPIHKDLDFQPSASLYISHEKPTFSRDLYMIPELSEVDTVLDSLTAAAIDDDPIHDDSSVPPTPPPLEQPQQTRPATLDKNTQPMYSESECKHLFRAMLESAYQQTHHRRPKEMCLVFNANDNIGAIRYISHDGKKKDQLGFAGPLQYIPPEYVSCTAYRHELLDVWALGISLYHMLVGRYPFDEENKTHLETFRQMHHQSEFFIPRELSPEVRDLLKHMLDPSITRRASFNFIRSHPWVHAKKSNTLVGTVKKVFRIVIKGPYPPPSYYTPKTKH